jgi:hypothetical protein
MGTRTSGVHGSERSDSTLPGDGGRALLNPDYCHRRPFPRGLGGRSSAQLPSPKAPLHKRDLRGGHILHEAHASTTGNHGNFADFHLRAADAHELCAAAHDVELRTHEFMVCEHESWFAPADSWFGRTGSWFRRARSSFETTDSCSSGTDAWFPRADSWFSRTISCSARAISCFVRHISCVMTSRSSKAATPQCRGAMCNTPETMRCCLTHLRPAAYNSCTRQLPKNPDQ